MIKLWEVRYNIQRKLRAANTRIKKVLRSIRLSRDLQRARKLINQQGNGDFYTHQVLEDAHWCDFIFISEFEGKLVPWNATLRTTKLDYHEKIQSIAFNEAWGAWPSTGKEIFSFERIEGTGLFRMVDNEPDLTNMRRRYTKLRELELYQSGQVRIAPWSYEIDYGYEWGVGLNARLHVPFINEEVINEFIREFSAHGRSIFSEKENYPISLSMDEVGIKFDEESDFLYWDDGTMGPSVAVDFPNRNNVYESVKEN